jgi:exodeoxyribonuclease V alpha subunit
VLALQHGWRAGGALARALTVLRAGDAEALAAELAQPADAGVALLPCGDAAALRGRVAAWIDAQADAYAAVFARAAEPTAALAALRRVQILCALRAGAFGAEGVNAACVRELALRFGFDTASSWYHGRPVLIVRNDYARELYNGDVGVALDGPEGLRVWFEVGRRDGSIGLRSVSPRALPAHESAWAITIHRSQGSEYGAVAVVLPPDPVHRLLSRELLYTAVSRATQRAEIWSSAAAVAAAAQRPVRRSGGLRARLA